MVILDLPAGGHEGETAITEGNWTPWVAGQLLGRESAAD